jgi:DNA-binding CsgD family transcriptional regulator
MRRIGGTLHYSVLAEQHRPRDPEQLRLEVVRLMSTGLTTQDIAMALRLQVDQVLNLLAEGPSS